MHLSLVCVVCVATQNFLLSTSEIMRLTQLLTFTGLLLSVMGISLSSWLLLNVAT
jgi:hypothetical protein